MLTISDKLYPKLLKKIPTPPKELYIKGTSDYSIFSNCIAVVGSRRMTDYGKRICEQFVFELASAGLTIVSGFMFGVDITAHKSAILAGGKTIAVMPCGIDLVIPSYEKKLHADICASGLVVSEYKGTLAPKNWTFVQRNRIVAGLCRAVLVIEAARSSGSLITAEYARSYGRRVFTVPGPITSIYSLGALDLVCQGKARMITSTKEILKLYKVNTLSTRSTLEELVLKELFTREHTASSLSSLLKVPIQLVNATLAVLTINGSVVDKDGSYYAN